MRRNSGGLSITLIPRLQAGEDLDLVAKVPAELDGFQHRVAAGPENRDLGPAIRDDQRRGRNARAGAVPGKLERHLAIGTGGQLLPGIVGLQLDRHRARICVQRM